MQRCHRKVKVLFEGESQGWLMVYHAAIFTDRGLHEMGRELFARCSGSALPDINWNREYRHRLKAARSARFRRNII